MLKKNLLLKVIVCCLTTLLTITACGNQTTTPVESSESTTSPPTDTSTTPVTTTLPASTSPTSPSPVSKSIVIDHNCTDISLIPDSWITAVKEKIDLKYWYASHGDQVNVGMDDLKKQDSFYTLSYEATWEDYGIGGNKDASDLMPPMKFDKITRQYLEAGNKPTVIAWAWCSGLTDSNQLGQGASADQVDNYLKAMNRLEIDYPDITFVYMTAHLDGSGETGTTNQRNQQIREYCRANGKVLFDFADIESYDPDGAKNYMVLNGNQDCSYSGGNWADEWMARNPDSELGFAGSHDVTDTDHTRILNCNLKGRAFWWLLARIAGWNGTPTSGAR
jgi:hypothetical protein